METKLNKQIHPFHLVDPSPWPLLGSIGALTATSGGVMWFHDYSGGGFSLVLGLSIIVFVMAFWWRDIIRENTFEGNQTSKVEEGMRMGMLLFITSEIMFFFAFFWAFFSSSINPDLAIGGVWPPTSIEVFNPWEVPLLNTLILLSSGATVTVCHNCLITGDRTLAIRSMVVTIILAAAFTGFQVFEYIHASFNISDGIYGSCFYMATGFHGFHVFVGTCFLTVCLYRIYDYQFTRENHFGFEAAAWYWHFVDVVWLFLFVAVYWWGGN
jgi:heme/copper-type cytochrome/quinol oxidase subunit 3